MAMVEVVMEFLANCVKSVFPVLATSLFIIMVSFIIAVAFGVFHGIQTDKEEKEEEKGVAAVARTPMMRMNHGGRRRRRGIRRGEKIVRFVEEVENIGEIRHGFVLKKDPQAAINELIRIKKEYVELNRIDKEYGEGVVREEVVGGSTSGVKKVGIVTSGIRAEMGCSTSGVEEVGSVTGFRDELVENSGRKGDVKEEDDVTNTGLVDVQVAKDEVVENVGLRKEWVEVSEIGVIEEVEDGGEISNAGAEKELVEVLEIGGKEEAKDEEGIDYARFAEELVGNLRVLEAKKEEEIGDVGLELEEESVQKLCGKEEEVKSDQWREVGVVEENLNEERVEKDEVPETNTEVVEVREQREMVEKDVRVEFVEHEVVEKRVEECNEGLLSDDDDWEGIDRTEIEKRFGAAAAFVGSSENSDVCSKLSSNVQMQLYGLHKVAIEGPCRGQAPLAIMMSARAKWNSWQRLGNMSSEVAMEQYVDLLSDGIPKWAGENPEGDHEEDKGNDSSEAGKSITTVDESSVLHQQIDSEKERKPERLPDHGEIIDVIGVSESREQG